MENTCVSSKTGLFIGFFFHNIKKKSGSSYAFPFPLNNHTKVTGKGWGFPLKVPMEQLKVNWDPQASVSRHLEIQQAAEQ